MSRHMNARVLLLLSALLPLGPALAQGPSAKAAKPGPHTAPPAHAAAAERPKQIGKFDDWIAATTPESGQTACYAFTRAQSSAPGVPGRGDVVLTVTERASGRDTVAISAGFAYPPNAEVKVVADPTALDFYTSGRSAFARDGKAAVAAFHKARTMVARSPGPHATTVADTFSMRGFSAAYAAIIKACPPK
jgi:hypothetical protein